MKLRRIPAIFLVFLAAMPLSAQNWEVYDNFKGPLIDPDRWIGSQQESSVLEFQRQIQSGWLQLRLRSFGLPYVPFPNPNDGVNWAENVLYMSDPAWVKGIRAKLTVTQAIGAACPPGGQRMIGQFGLVGSFFNRGEGTGDPAGIDDISAELYLYMYSGTSEYQVGYRIVYGGGQGPIVNDTLGWANVGEPIYVWLRWDKGSKTFFFGLQRLSRKLPPLEVPFMYDFPDSKPPTGEVRRLHLITLTKNCNEVQEFSDVAVKVDQVDVIR